MSFYNHRRVGICRFLEVEVRRLDILFSSNHNIHKSSCGVCFWASDPDPLIDRFYYNLWIKGSKAQKQKPHEFL